MSKDELKVELWDINDVKPSNVNAKNHPDDQVQKIANSIKEFNFDQPIVVDVNGEIIKGHGRRLAAIKLGLKKVPVIQRKDLTAEQARLARLADNKVSESDFDVELLQAEMMDLSINFDLKDFGFSDHELDFMTQDMDGMDESALIDDLNKEVNAKDQRDQETIDDIEQGEVSLSRVWQESKCTVNQSRVIRAFRDFLEAQYPEETTHMSRFCRFIEDSKEIECNM